MKNKQWKIFAVVILFLTMGVFYSFYLRGTEEPSILETTIPALEDENTKQAVLVPEKEEKVYVHICGQVKNPGVYALKPDSRVAEAVEMAGGFTKEAQETSINLARKVEDGEQLYVLSKEESYESAPLETKVSKETLLNINLAGKEELMTLPGIGETKAEAIVTYRSQYGKFKKIEDLTKIEGIKEGVFEKIKDKIKT